MISIEPTFSPKVTHFISRGEETPLLAEVTNSEASCRVVSDAWVIACYSFLNVMASKAYPVVRRKAVEPSAPPPVQPDPDLADVLGDAVDDSSTTKEEEESVSVVEVKVEKKSTRKNDRDSRKVEETKDVDAEAMKKRRRRMFLG